jgi:hypothetical protein
MKIRNIGISLFFCIRGLGLPLAAADLTAKVSVQEISDGQVGPNVYSEAIRIIGLSDGSSVVLHPFIRDDEKQALAGAEASPILATIFLTPGGVHTRHMAANWIRRSRLTERDQGSDAAAGTVGQFYGATLLSDGKTLAFSVGWSDRRGQSHNGVFLAERGSTVPGLVGLKMIDVPGRVADIMAGPGNLLLAVTEIPSRRGNGRQPPLVSVLDTNGHLRGGLAGAPDSPSPGDRAARLRSRLIRIDETTYALYDAEFNRLIRVHLTAGSFASHSARPSTTSDAIVKLADSPTAEVSISELSSISLSENPESLALTKSPRTTAVHVTRDGSILTVRSIVAAKQVRTLVSRYDSSGKLLGTWSPAVPFRAAYFIGDILAAVSFHPGPETTALEFVTFDPMP